MSEIEKLNAVIDSAPKVPLGDLIAPVTGQVNKDGNDYPFMGVNIAKQIVPTVANTSTVDSRKYIFIKNRQFVFSGMQTGRDECIRFTMYTGSEPVLLSPAYTILQVKDSNIVLPEYIFVQFLSSEMDRMGWFYSDSSVRANLDLPRFLEIRIPLPSIEVQQRYVDAYVGLQKLAEENEALSEPLSKACQACLSDARKKYTSVKLADYIEAVDNRNFNGDYSVDHLQGVTSAGVFDYSKAKTDGIDFTKYKVVKEGCFAYNPSRINLGSIALRKGMDCIISPMYIVFKVNTKGQDELLPEFLYLWFMRPEFQRSTLFYASGSVRDTFGYNEMCRVNIPLPPIEVQQSIVALHRCAEEARSIASKAREALSTICPAMIQRASHEMH